MEEATELAAAAGASDSVAVMDALADVVYAAYSAALTYGIDLDAVLLEVHRSNMTKIGGDSRATQRGDGRVLKPDSVERPTSGACWYDGRPFPSPERATLTKSVNPQDPAYDAYERRTPDSQYGDLLRRICAQGVSVPTRQGPPALTLMQQTTTYDLRNGFPLITERSLGTFWTKAIGELCAFINGATTVSELEGFGCNWWGQWATDEKTSKRGLEPESLGPGSYGGAFHDFPGPGGPFDQFQHLVEQITELPELRTHFVSPWIPVYQVRGEGKTPRTTIAPCHGWVHVRVLGDALHLHMFQRSADVPVGVPSNMVQYAALMLMLAQITGYRPATFYHTMSDAHIYEDQLEHVGRMLTRPARPLPTVTLNAAGRAVDDIHDFRPDHFELADYAPHPAVPGIPVST